jgi:hypothetical protein
MHGYYSECLILSSSGNLITGSAGVMRQVGQRGAEARPTFISVFQKRLITSMTLLFGLRDGANCGVKNVFRGAL